MSKDRQLMSTLSEVRRRIVIHDGANVRWWTQAKKGESNRHFLVAEFRSYQHRETARLLREVVAEIERMLRT